MSAPGISPESRFVLAPGVRLQRDRVSGDPLLLSSEGILVLNLTAAEIVKRCGGQTTVEEIVNALAAEYEAPADELRADVFECLEHLRDKRLITEAP